MAILAARKLIPAAALALAACAQQPWTRVDTTDQQRDRDQGACAADARREVQKRYSKSESTMGPAIVGGGQGRRGVSGPGPFSDQRGTQLSEEDHLVAECMRAKGYQRK